jgi:hypothetical protein
MVKKDSRLHLIQEQLLVEVQRAVILKLSAILNQETNAAKIR